MSRSLGLSLVLVMVVGTSGLALAQDPDWRHGGRALYVSSGTSSDRIENTKYWLDMESGPGLEYTAGVMVSPRFGAEFSVGASAHSFNLTRRCCEIDGGRVWLVPLIAIAQYHVKVYGDWDPYVGLGLTWIMPFYKLSDDLGEAGFEELEFEGGAGVVAQVGVNYQLDNRWYVNLDLRYLGASLEARLSTEDEDYPPVTLDIEPFVVGLGFGYRF